ncbi:Phosphatidate phosphatase LPIN1 [Rhizoctonia solani]|uniref:phosphatidate phosphatase n=1 Tax=Rhizoctonia solani TaxID=456999 RepID=A0A0K6FTR2_9AGAM|nr:Phosphatidate phosphatase LPIN1 [Rhizoctonia solani]
MYLVRGIVTAATAPYQIYKDLNPSTLTGAIDVIVVERRAENGETELACSPFHVRFGKWQVLLPADKKVSVYVNNKPIPFNMKIGEAGEAFFVFETDEDVPEELMTSPILEPVRPGQDSKKPVAGDRLAGRFGAKKARAKEQSTLLGDVVVSGDEGNKTGVTSDQEPEFLDLSDPSAPRPRGYSPTPPLSPPMSTSTLETSTLPASTPPTEHGSLPQSFLSKAINATKAAAHITTEEIEEKKDATYDLLRFSKGPGGVEGVDPSDGVDEEEARKLREAAQPPEIRYGHDVVLDMAGYHSKSQADDSNESSTEPESSLQPRRPSLSKTKPHSEITLSPSAASHAPFTRGSSEPPERMPATQNEYSWEWGAMPKLSSDTPQLGGSPSASTIRGNSPPNLATVPLAEPRAPSSTHIGLGHPSGTGARPESRLVSESDSFFGDGGILAAESGAESNELISMEHQGIKRLTFELSLCGPLASSMDPPEAAKQFATSKIALQRLLEDASTVHSEKLVIRWDEKYISRTDGTPLFDALVAWRDNTLAHRVSIASSSQSNTPRNRSSWLWWGRSRSDRVDVEDTRGTERPPFPDPPSAPAGLDLDGVSNRAASPPISPTSENESEIIPNKHYAKTLRLTSEQLKSLDLKKGANSITFSLSSGVIACTARIFLWDAHDHIVISDIDGTITKSDALGHVFTMIGRDWTHLGVAKLYTDIARNGYKIMYLTSRAIGQADSTRDYLKGIKQNNFQLPEGPVIMSPDRLMASLHREVIMRKPEVFKMACLRDIQRLFGNEYRNPFYAGFGNRITDALSYRSVNVPSDRIFTIDSSGEVKMELLELAGYKSSYIHMTDLVDQMFPPVHRRWAPEYTDFNFWRTPLPEIELPDLSPPSPALSAHSNTSGGSRLGRFVSLGRSTSRASSTDARQAQKDMHLGDTERRRTTSHPGRMIREGTINVRPSSPLTGPAMSAEDLDAISDAEGRMQGGVDIDREHRRRMSFDSMPGSFEERKWATRDVDEEDSDEIATQDGAFDDGDEDGDEGDDEHDDEDEDEEPQFDTLATDEMEDTPFL